MLYLEYNGLASKMKITFRVLIAVV